MADLVCPPGDVTVVLCRPSDPRNIGSAIRAVANFGLGGLHLVSDEPLPPEDQLDAFASGALPKVRLRCFTDVRAALEGMALVAGTSRRHHHEDGPPRWPLPDLGRRLVERRPAAVLFGHERSGLSRDELDLCDAVIEIPTSAQFPSMNLSHAVACLGYELARPDPSAWASEPPKRTRALDRDVFFREIAEICETVGYPPGRSGKTFARRLRRILGRADASPAELSLVAGVFRELRRLTGVRSGPDR